MANAVGHVRCTGARVFVVSAVAASLLLTLPACPKDPYDADTWINKLDDSREVERAITELSRLKDPKSIKPLGATWRKFNRPARVLRVIIDIADQHDRGTVNEADPELKGNPKLIEAEKRRSYGPFYEKGPFWEDAVPFLVEAVEEFMEDEANARAIENATVAVDALGRAKEFTNVEVEVLIRAATLRMPPDAAGQRVRLAALRALGKFDEDPRAVDTLIKVLNSNVEEQHLHLFAAAADALAQARSTKAIEPLVRAMYMIPPVYQFCRRSLVAIGEPAIPVLIQVFDLKHKEMNQLAKENDFANNCKKAMGPKTKCKAPTNLEFKAAQLLGDLHAKEAVDDLIAGLKKEPQPAFFGSQGEPGPSQHQAILDALRNIGDPKAADPLLDYIIAKDTDDLLRPMAIDSYSFLTRDTKILPHLEKFMKDDDEDFQVRVASGLTYGRLAREDKQLAPLEYMIERNKAKVKEWEKKAKPADKAYQAIKKKYDPAKEAFDKAAAEWKTKKDNASKAETKAWEKRKETFGKLERDYYAKESDKYISEGNANDFRIFQRTFEQHLARAKVGIVCKDDPKCYMGYLDKTDDQVAESLKKWIPDVDDWDKDEKHELKMAACERALLEISKMGPKAQPVFDDLLKALPSTERFIRQGTLLALQHVAEKPCKRCVEVLDGIIKDQETQSTLNALTADARVWRYYFQWANK